MEVASGSREKVTVFGDDFDTIDGTGVRDYIHVTDLVNAHVNALKLVQNGQSDTINLGSSSQFSVLEVIKSAEKITGREIPFEIVNRREGDPPTVHASCNYAKKVLNWSASQSNIENIIETTWRICK
jgi:UDP-glucose 4-epimerase